MWPLCLVLIVFLICGTVVLCTYLNNRKILISEARKLQDIREVRNQETVLNHVYQPEIMGESAQDRLERQLLSKPH